MDFLFYDWLGTPAWFWLAFAGLVFVLTAFDLGFLHKEDREMGIAESLRLSVFYIAIASVFGAWVWWAKGSEDGIAYFTGYFIEKALSIDNVFVISMIFGFFAIAPKYQYRALLWGIMAVIVLRGLMIAGGVALVSQAHWVMYIFAAFLVFTGVKMLFAKEQDPDIGNNPVIRWISRHMRVTKAHHAEHFFVRERNEAGRLVWAATPLFLALVIINLADLVFAVDSVPAIFSITTDTFIVYTSNIMAILGLRALYFALAAMVHRFHYLKYALALVLVFIGAKILVADFVMGGAKFPPLISLGVTLALIAGGVGWSLWKTRGEEPRIGH
ncbi:TerC family protein [Novosphingobium aerophilum]|uniref:TerC family protein n=1 Tax=Novosphingobium TaxID=165696 RepID=UPI0012C1169E|nr:MULTISPECIES: TerC family protein [unclassified Novosphingobium]MPS68537.1 TerC family protein [Novosphingobium sp.]WRT93875.1 TerC family protein [Novosphingobium sp. RL4]